MSGKTTPETCGKQLENLWAEIEAVVRGLGGWVVRAYVGRKTPARLPVEWQSVPTWRTSFRAGLVHMVREWKMPRKCRL